MFSYFLGYLDTKEAHALLDGKLREANDDPDSRFCTLKRRLKEHFELLRKEDEFRHEMDQHMIDILVTDGDYEEKLKRVVAKNTEGPLSRLWSIHSDYLTPLAPRFDTPSKTTPNGYKLDEEDDAFFLMKICTMIMEKPAYRQIGEEILQEATKSLGTKLKKLEKELLHLVMNHVKRVVGQEIDDRVNTEKQHADLAANARLRFLIREALDAEVDHPTDRWVFTTP